MRVASFSSARGPPLRRASGLHRPTLRRRAVYVGRRAASAARKLYVRGPQALRRLAASSATAIVSSRSSGIRLPATCRLQLYDVNIYTPKTSMLSTYIFVHATMSPEKPSSGRCAAYATAPARASFNDNRAGKPHHRRPPSIELPQIGTLRHLIRTVKGPLAIPVESTPSRHEETPAVIWQRAPLFWQRIGGM